MNNNNNKGRWVRNPRLTEEQRQKAEENRLVALAMREREKRSQQHSTSNKSTTKSNLTPPKPAVGNTHDVTPSPAVAINAAPPKKKRNLADTGFTTAAALLIEQGGNKRHKPNLPPPSNQTKKVTLDRKSPHIGRGISGGDVGSGKGTGVSGTATHGRKSNDDAVDLTADSESDDGGDVDKWPCTQCTLLNDPSASVCAACSHARRESTTRGSDVDEWPCTQCTLLNDPSVSVCAACGRARQRESTREKKQLNINDMMSTSSKPVQKRASSNSAGCKAPSASHHPSTARTSRSARAPSSKSAVRKAPSKKPRTSSKKSIDNMDEDSDSGETGGDKKKNAMDILMTSKSGRKTKKVVAQSDGLEDSDEDMDVPKKKKKAKVSKKKVSSKAAKGKKKKGNDSDSDEFDLGSEEEEDESFAAEPARQQARSSKPRPHGSAAARSKPAVSNEPSFDYKVGDYLYSNCPSEGTYSEMKDKTPQNRSPSNKVVPTNEDALLETMKMKSLLECVDSIPLNNFNSLQKCHEDESFITSTNAKLAELEKNLPPHAWDKRVEHFKLCLQCCDGKSPAVALPVLTEKSEGPILCIGCAQDAETSGIEINWRPCIGCGDEVPAGRSSCADCLGDNVCINFGTSCQGTSLFKFTNSASRFCDDCYAEDQASRKCECGATGLVIGRAKCPTCFASSRNKTQRKRLGYEPDCLRCGLPMWGDDQEDFSLGGSTKGCKRDDCYRKCRTKLPSGQLCDGLRAPNGKQTNGTPKFRPRCKACYSNKVSSPLL